MITDDTLFLLTEDQRFKQSFNDVYHEGNDVFVVLRSDKHLGRAKIIQKPATTSINPNSEEATEEMNRYQVKYEKRGGIHSVNPKRLLQVYPLRNSGNFVLLCDNTDEYRRLARSQVVEEDKVADIGSSFGKCTNILSQHSKDVFGIEISPEVIEKSREAYPHLVFHHFDILHNEILSKKLLGDRNKIFIDIGGNREINTVVEILRYVLEKIKPQLVVVKSKELTKDARQFLRQHELNYEIQGQIWWPELKEKYAQLKEEKEDGFVIQSWFQKEQLKGFTKNPLRYPQTLTRKGVQICRPHNYRRDGCGETCKFDHKHCHHCGEEGHRALFCLEIHKINS